MNLANVVSFKGADVHRTVALAGHIRPLAIHLARFRQVGGTSAPTLDAKGDLGSLPNCSSE